MSRLFKGLGLLGFVAILLVSVSSARSKGVDRSGYLGIYVLNVGQGDSIMIRSPEGIYGLIDAGRGGRVIEELDKVLPFGFSGFDFIIASHSDSDHIGGIEEVVREYNVDKVFWNRTTKSTSVTRNLDLTLQLEGVNREELYAGDTLNIGCCLLINTLSPSVDSVFNTRTDENDKSIGVSISYSDFNMFLGGDLTKKGEDMALYNISNKYLDFEVSKIGHHGSKTSTSGNFLKETNPEVAVIPVGKNSYGHPNQEVLDLLNLYDVDIIRTDLAGTVKIETDGSLVSIYTNAGLVQRFYSK